MKRIFDYYFRRAEAEKKIEKRHYIPAVHQKKNHGINVNNILKPFIKEIDNE